MDVAGDSGRDRELLSALPPAHGRRGRAAKLAGRALDIALEARQRAAGVGRELDVAAAEMPRRRLAVLGIYGAAGAAAMTRAVAELGRSRHNVHFTLGALDSEPAPDLREHTIAAGLGGGKFQNLNRLIAAADPAHPGSDWTLLIDDDIDLPRRFADRALCAAEALDLDLAQPALSRASHSVFDVTRRRAAMARETPFVEIGPAVLLGHRAWGELAPFPEAGMGWGLDLHWAALAAARGWRCGVIDATPVRHERRPTAGSYDRAAATAAAVEFLREHDHLRHDQVERVITSHPGLP